MLLFKMKNKAQTNTLAFQITNHWFYNNYLNYASFVIAIRRHSRLTAVNASLLLMGASKLVTLYQRPETPKQIQEKK